MDPNEVPHEKVGPAKVVAQIDKDRDGDGETKVAQKDQLGILGLVQRAARVEVVDAIEQAVLLALSSTLRLALVVVVASDVGQELLTEKHDEGHDWGLFAQLRKFVGQLAETGGLLLTSLGYEDHVALHVAGSLVVLAVRNLPAKDPANSVVEDLGRAESLVAALVSQNPHTGAEQTLDKCVEGPEQGPHGRRGDVLWGHVVVEEVEGGTQTHNVAGNIVEARGGGSLIAVLGDGITNILDGVVGDFEFVAADFLVVAASSEARDDSEVDEAEGLGESRGEATADTSLSTVETVFEVAVRRTAGVWRARPVVFAAAMSMS
ncbi:hypothetical protein RRF57_011235 [Xylaria bambusicola]|uniref:Uncharacterized protein n=1 Tax=Xylaria bambusicola TaxID=326684 RepID=A0AAN7UXS7_9PEZI